MDRIDKIAKNVVSSIKIASEPEQIPWTFKEQGQVANLIKSTKAMRENLKRWLNFYKSGEANNYGYDCDMGVKSTTKLLVSSEKMQKQLEEAYKAITEFDKQLG